MSIIDIIGGYNGGKEDYCDTIIFLFTSGIKSEKIRLGSLRPTLSMILNEEIEEIDLDWQYIEDGYGGGTTHIKGLWCLSVKQYAAGAKE